MDELLHFSRNPITFEYTPGHQRTTFLNLRNVSEHPVAYKVKIKDVKRYSVRPSAAIIEPNAQMDVELTQQALKEQPNYENDSRDRLLLLFARVDLVPIGNGAGKFHGYESALDLWKAIPSEVIQKEKLGVVVKMAKSSNEKQMRKEHSFDTDVKPPSIGTTYVPTDSRYERSDDSSVNAFVAGAVSPAVPQVVTGSKRDSESMTKIQEAKRETPQSSSSFEAAMPIVITGRGVDGSEVLSAQAEDCKNEKDGSDEKKVSSDAQNDIDYASVEYARERVRGIRIAPKISLLSLDEHTKQRVAAERAGELLRTIEARGKEIDKINRDLAEARHRLHDAMAATAPAYDVKYEVSESSRVPYAQIAIMAIISGAILQLLV